MIGLGDNMKKMIAKRHSNRECDGMMNSADQAGLYDDVIDLSLGDPDLNTDDRIIEAAFQDVKAGFTHYAPAYGDPDLIKTIQEDYQTTYRYPVDRSEIMITASGCHAMWLVLETILDPEDEVIIFSPYFTPYPEQIKLAQGKPVIVCTKASDGFQIDIEDLKQHLTNRTKVILINTPNNPTGVCIRDELLIEISQLAIDYDLLVIADDIYTLYDYHSPFLPITTLENMRERTISIRSFSKDFCMSGWRIGYVIAPPELIAAMRTVNENNVFVAPIMSQRAAYHAILMKQEIQKPIREIFLKRALYIYERIEHIDYLDILEPEGSIYSFVDIRKTGLSSQAFADRLFEKYHISVVPGVAFGEAGEGYIRIAQRVDLQTLKHVFDLLEKDEEWNTKG